MKKSVHITGIACAILTLLGCTFKINHWPGAAPIIILAILLFCFVFLPLALITNYKSQEVKKYKALHIVTFFAFTITMMGALFKVMHWPGAGLFLIIGIPMPFVLFLPVYLYQTRNENKSGNLNFLGIMFGLIFLAIFSVLLALSVSRNIIETAALNISTKEKTIVFIDTKLKGAKNDSNVEKAANELCNYIDNLKCELLTATGNDICINNKINSDYNILNLNLKDDKDIPIHVLVGGENKIFILRDKVEAFHKSLLDSKKMSPELANLTNELLNVKEQEAISSVDGTIYTQPWEEREIPNLRLVFLLNSLSQIQSNVRLVESELY